MVNKFRDKRGWFSFLPPQGRVCLYDKQEELLAMVQKHADRNNCPLPVYYGNPERDFAHEGDPKLKAIELGWIYPSYFEGIRKLQPFYRGRAKQSKTNQPILRRELK